MNEQNKPEHSELWKSSGLTQQAYCTREGIIYQSFVYQHNRANKLKKPPINFIEAKIQSISAVRSSPGLQVILPSGVRIGFDGEITSALLQTIFSSAGNISC